MNEGVVGEFDVAPAKRAFVAGILCVLSVAFVAALGSGIGLPALFGIALVVRFWWLLISTPYRYRVWDNGVVELWSVRRRWSVVTEDISDVRFRNRQLSLRIQGRRFTAPITRPDGFVAALHDVDPRLPDR